MMDAPELKACPFCGGEAADYRGNDAACVDSTCPGFKMRHCSPSMWNRRTPDPRVAALVEAARLATRLLPQLMMAVHDWQDETMYDQAQSAEDALIAALAAYEAAP
jgi:hypothetical protein